MVWVVVAVVVGGTLVLAVAWLAVVVLRLRTQVAHLETRSPSSDPTGAPRAVPDLSGGSLDDQPEYVITRIGEVEQVGSAPVETVARIDAVMFTDILVKESVVQAASLAHGLRRALSPETRHRIRFHMRAEAKRSRKQRRAELRDVRREWAARQRAGMTAEDPAA